jgi:hypothetical protein
MSRPEGVMYNFPTPEVPIVGMIHHMTRRFEPLRGETSRSSPEEDLSERRSEIRTLPENFNGSFRQYFSPRMFLKNRSTEWIRRAGIS